MFKSFILSTFLIAASISFLSLCGCNTVKGMGEDMQQGGKAIQKAAKD